MDEKQMVRLVLGRLRTSLISKLF